ncbi:---NA--- [Octopus vulgaris]|uniref:---NA n=1 Tax=Octopus vulgaris TaxID=6645 RepID=A0AA36C1D8_OCTVU|nr:---NA--- [Octopus vulgaris]
MRSSVIKWEEETKDHGLNELTKHKRTRTGENPYHSDICGKYIHMREKPYRCDICDKSFSANCDLTSNKHIHAGEKPLSL